MLLHSVAVITLVATSIATRPPGYIKQPGNDKNSPDYQYQNYDIGNDDGKSQGKIEARYDELASGRYNVNSDQSQTDVKYFADELGYQPLVKYRSSNEQSTAGGALFTIGEEAFKRLQNDDDVIGASGTVREGQTIQAVQIIQPYMLHKEGEVGGGGGETLQIVKHDQSILGDNRDVKPGSLLESNISEESRNINYVNLPQRQSFEVISSNGIPSGDGFTSSHSTTLPVIVQSAAIATAQTSPVDISYVNDSGDNKNDLSSEITEEQLFNENSGTFGQRLGINSPPNLPQSMNQHSLIHQQEEILPNNLSPKRYKSMPIVKKNRVDLYNVGFSGHLDLTQQLPSQSAFNAFPSTTLSPIVTTATNQYSSVLPAFSNAIETSQKTVYPSTENPRHKESEIGLSNPQQINYALQSSENQFKTHGSSPSISDSKFFPDKKWMTPIPKALDGFSKPIVVAEVSNHKPFEYSTTFECEDNITSSTPMPLYPTTLRAPEIIAPSNLENKPYDTISSIVLNPIQAGVALVNAGKEHFISRTANNLPIVEKKVDHNIEADTQKTNQQITTTTTTEKSGIEIQKSIEIYHNAPIQEIHYPPQMFSQVIHIDQLHGGQRYIAENAQNSKHLPRSDASSATNSPYEINHDATIYQNIPEDKSHVYLINQEFNENIFQSQLPKLYIYPKQLESRDLKANIEMKEQSINAIRTGNEQVDESIQTYRSPGNKLPDPNHHTQQILPSYSENLDFQPPSQKSTDKKQIHYSKIEKKSPYQMPQIEKQHSHQMYSLPLEKLVEKKIPLYQKIMGQPFAIEKIVEKQLHVPLIPVEKLVEKKIPYPIEIEKIVERKIPIEVAKYLEKPVPIHVPYGVQYGVSYQQIMKPQNHNLYSTQTTNSLPLYGLSIIKNNLTQPLQQTFIYQKPFIGLLEQKLPLTTNPYFMKNFNPKKQIISHFTISAQPTYSIYNPNNRRRHALHRLTTKEKAEMDGYIGPVPMQHTSNLPHHSQGQQHGFQSKASNFHSTIATRSPSPITTLRKVKQQDLYHPIGKGSFRQSKMEYGFKPPMIPSVQYDEETASKVES
ncbi:uncharacterized protein LOC122512895 [Leptopilina heterotoma]|uniref:uncharacterized protein LOC122512895 n=1 Tax=Leptopilina heterotoma TaxID=63436 RepID=UPI001CA96778|nr:uncharacterized protein LOC122512895 [Leptopilina heterotoma]